MVAFPYDLNMYPHDICIFPHDILIFPHDIFTFPPYIQCWYVVISPCLCKGSSWYKWIDKNIFGMAHPQKATKKSILIFRSPLNTGNEKTMSSANITSASLS